jgi:hypothetical protein
VAKKKFKDAMNPLTEQTNINNALDEMLVSKKEVQKPLPIAEKERSIVGASKNVRNVTSVNIDSSLAEKIKDYLCTVANRNDTMSAVVNRAVATWIESYEANNGEIPTRETGTALRPGRPFK